MDEYPFVLGSAGHIDHGKTTLVRALTGVDCDRLEEEKRRGITIELGFAPLALPSGRIVSIVDVPGHERFIRQMVAGSAGIDAVMLVVAADEGVMPQTREHLDILKLLGVTNGLVVIAKSDLVDDDLLDLAAADVRALTEGTFLEKAPLLFVSSILGTGLDSLITEIDSLVTRTPPRNRSGAFFMPIDRAFGIKGFGSIVTGTSFHGTLREGEEVDIVPAGLRSRVRSIQIHKAATKEVVAGQRIAVNLASVSLEDLHRGDVVCAKERFFPTECLDVLLEILPSAPEPIKHWQRLRFHIGTADVVARVSILQAENSKRAFLISPGESVLAQILPESPIAAASGERFVVRFYSPLATIGGGEVLLPYAQRAQNVRQRAERHEFLLELLKDKSPASFLSALIKDKGMIAERELFALSQMEPDSFDRAVEEVITAAPARGVFVFGYVDAEKNRKPQKTPKTRKMFCSQEVFERSSEAITSKLSSFHGERPERFGMAVEELMSSWKGSFSSSVMTSKDFRALLDLLVAEKRISSLADGENETKFCLPGFTPSADTLLSGKVKRVRELLEDAGFNLLDSSALLRTLEMPPSELNRVIGYLKEKEGLRVTSAGMLLPKTIFEKALALMSSMQGDITVATFRDGIGTSRKYALAILELMDSQGITLRVGVRRILRKR